MAVLLARVKCRGSVAELSGWVFLFDFFLFFDIQVFWYYIVSLVVFGFIFVFLSFFLKIFIYSFDISLSLFHSVIQLLRIVSFHSVLFGSQSVIFVRG